MQLLLETTNLLGATFSLAIAIAILFTVRFAGLGGSRVTTVLAAFFVLRALDQLAAPDPVLGYDARLDAFTDIALLPVLAILLWEAGRIARATADVVGAAERRRREYQRALGDYRQLVRHRLANPLTVVKGAALTLQEGRVDERTHAELVDAIVRAAAVIEDTSFEPVAIGIEERGLEPAPRLSTHEHDDSGGSRTWNGTRAG